MDFRVESNGNANMLFVDGGNDVVNIGGTTVIGAALTVGKTSVGSNTALRIDYNDDTTAPSSVLELSKEGTVFGRFGGASTTVSGAAATAVVVQSQADLYFDATGSFIFNEVGDDVDFRVESNTKTHALFVDGGSDYIAMGTGDQNNGGLLNLNAVSGSTVLTMTTRSATDGHTNIFTMLKTPATSGNYTATASGDILGDIRFMGVNTDTVADIGARIQVEQTGTASGTVPAKMIFMTNESTAMTLDASQNLLVGKSSASETSAGFQIAGGNVATIGSSSGFTYQVNDGSAFKWRVNANGGVYNFQSNNVNLSDQREKKNIEALGAQWNAVKAWSVKEFHYNEDEDSDAKKVGVIAQDVETNHPNLVTDFELSEDKTRKAVKEQQLMWLAIKALQEAQARIETLETKVAALEG